MGVENVGQDQGGEVQFRLDDLDDVRMARAAGALLGASQVELTDGRVADVAMEEVAGRLVYGFMQDGNGRHRVRDWPHLYELLNLVGTDKGHTFLIVDGAHGSFYAQAIGSGRHDLLAAEVARLTDDGQVMLSSHVLDGEPTGTLWCVPTGAVPDDLHEAAARSPQYEVPKEAVLTRLDAAIGMLLFLEAQLAR